MKSILAVLMMPAAIYAATCESLRSLSVPASTITAAEVRTAGEFAPPTGQLLRNLPAFCRVTGVIRPTADSDIRFEVWMPAEAWNGKFQGVGNGGFAGSVNYTGMADAIRNHYASASTNTGHDDSGTSAQWALNHPEKIVDFGHRAIHLTAVNAKAVISGFYGDAPKRSFFNSCSNGGRQALMEAQRYPADYDGIIAGAPANYWSHLLSTAAAGVRATLAEADSYIPPVKLQAIEGAALAQCDLKDGVKDGVIENPLACPFDPSVLQCKGAETDACLTTPQLAALKTIYGGLRSSKGQSLFPGLSYGGENEAGGWASWVTGPEREKSEMFKYGTQYFRNMVYSDPNWQFRGFDADRDTKAADDRTAAALNSNSPDLSAFEKRGGKLLLYHGWADAAIPATNAVNYYDSVIAKMGSKAADGFVRLYMVPGMEHCAGGAGPATFGQITTPDGDRFHSLDAALEAWVEQGAAPDRIIASYKKGGTHPLCPWPQTAHYKGSGDTADAVNFTCAK